MAVYKDRIKLLIQNIMKKILFFSCIAAALLSFAGCEETGNDYEGTNYIYLESLGGNTTVWEQDETPLVVTVMLTSALSEDLKLTFAVEGTEGVLDIEGNPVTIKAGQKTASFAIVSKNADKVTGVENFKVVLDAATVLPDKVQLKEGFSFVVRSAAVSALTDAQKDIVEAYKTATGIDLSKYLGVVNVSTRLTGITVDTYETFDKTVTGKTIIILADESTSEQPVLKMITNPMGIETHMYDVLKTLTIKSETWLEEGESADPCFGILMDGINWNDGTEEIFQMSLDGIKLGAESVDFVGEGVDQWGDQIQIVPFEYSFTAYDREVAVIDELSKDIEYWSSDATSNPAYHLNCTGITEDDTIYNYGDEDEEGNEYYAGETWVEASGVISNDKLEFTFCTATGMDEDYTRVVATYTPNN